MKNYKLVISLTLLLFIFAAFNIKSESSSKGKIIGVKIYEYKGDFNLLFNKWKELGINTVFAGTELLSDSEFISLAKKNNIDTYVILPIFFSPEDLAKDSSLYAITRFGKIANQEWVKFVCPSDGKYRAGKIKFISDFVSKYHPTGISLDFIRHFVYWEKVYPDADYDSLPNT